RDAVLPRGARRAMQQISRAGREHERTALPAGACLTAKTERAGGQERNAHHLAEHRAVLVPADRRAGLIFDEQDLLQVGRLQAGEAGRALAQPQEELRYVIGLGEAAAIEIVAPAK